MDSRTAGEVTLFTGAYPFPLLPSEYIRRNVRITPIPRAHQSPAPFFDDLQECVVFSSDYPHFEGSPEPMAFYDQLLAGVDPARRAAFLGGNMAEVYARMGDPLPI
jgi:predicted TIM-barrel fold metal-dependent hydrolase